MRTRPLYVDIEQTAFRNNVISFTRYVPGGSRIFSLHQKGSRTRICILAATAFRGNSVTCLYGGSVDESKSLDLFSSLYLPSVACFVMEEIAFRDAYFEWSNVLFRA
jgi:hypothetical protein